MWRGRARMQREGKPRLWTGSGAGGDGCGGRRKAAWTTGRPPASFCAGCEARGRACAQTETTPPLFCLTALSCGRTGGMRSQRCKRALCLCPWSLAGPRLPGQSVAAMAGRTQRRRTLNRVGTDRADSERMYVTRESGPKRSNGAGEWAREGDRAEWDRSTGLLLAGGGGAAGVRSMVCVGEARNLLTSVRPFAPVAAVGRELSAPLSLSLRPSGARAHYSAAPLFHSGGGPHVSPRPP